MNLKVFSITGWVLMVLGIIISLGAILTQIIQVVQRNGYGMSDILEEGLIFGAIIFILVFLPGWKYYKISKKGTNNKLEAWAVILTTITIILEIILFCLLLLIGYLEGAPAGDFEGIIWGMAIFGGFLLIPYGLAVLLLVINLFRRK